MGKQGRGRRLTDRERLEIVEYARLHPQVKHVELAAQYHVNESTIRKWRRESNACKVQARCASSGCNDRRRGQAARAQQFDSQLYAWICAARDRGEKLRPATIRAKARVLATTYEQMASFKASSGWYYRYCRRFGLTLEDSRDDKTQSSHAVSSLEEEKRSDSSAVGAETLTPCKQQAGDASPTDARTAWTLEPEPEESGAACQATIAHFLHHHAALLSRPCRSRFIQYLADVPEELKAFAHMSSAARVQYAKNFAEMTPHESKAPAYHSGFALTAV